MKLTKTLLVGAALLVTVLAGGIAARSILEKTLYYVAGGAVSSTKYWTLHLGNHDVKLNRKFPGEDNTSIDASVNLSLVSSGYVEGNGFSAKGKIQCRAEIAVLSDGVMTNVPVDSIDFIADGGRKIKLLNGKRGEMVINVEGFQVKPNQLQLWTFTRGTDLGEEVLKKSAEVEISAFSFSKEGIDRARKDGL